MRRLFLRWLKTQWTALPLAFLLVTAFEFWRTENGNDGGNCRDRAAEAPPADAADQPRHLPPADQLPSTKPPTNVDPKAADVGRKPPRKDDVATGAASAGNRPWKKYGVADIFVNTSRPVVNPHPFHYIINCPDLCRDVDVFLLNYVHTAVDHFNRRARIRRTWALQSHYRNFTIRTVFFVGLVNKTSKTSWYQDALYYEARKYGDIVQKDFIDTYRNLSYKGVAALQWITEHCDHAKYIMKTDDDVFVNMFALLHHLHDLYVHGFRSRLIACLVWWRGRVLRQGRWKIPVEELPDDVYPRYCSGMGYVFSTDVAVAMYRVSFFVKFFWVDDAFITGFLPRALAPAVNHTSMSRAYCGAHEMGLYWHETEWYKYIFTHVHNDTLYRTTWEKLVDMASRRTMPSPRVIRPGTLAEHYLPKHIVWPSRRKNITRVNPKTKKLQISRMKTTAHPK